MIPLAVLTYHNNRIVRTLLMMLLSGAFMIQTGPAARMGSSGG